MEKMHRTQPYEGKKKMFAVLGASGHVGTAVTQYLLQQGQAVTVVLRACRVLQGQWVFRQSSPILRKYDRNIHKPAV